MKQTDTGYVELSHRYMLETDLKDVFENYKIILPEILEFLQDNNQIKAYSLDNCAAVGNEAEGFVKGRVTFKLDRYYDITWLMDNIEINKKDTGENNDDRK